MALLGPMVLVTETSAADLLNALRDAGGFPIVETRWTGAPAAIAEVQPVALVIADCEPPPPRRARELQECLQSRASPVMPVMAAVKKDCAPTIPIALPVGVEEPTERLIARLRSALRIRTMHATVMRRARNLERGTKIPVHSNLLADATVLCVGRGGSYPVLSVAIGERVGIIGAFSTDTAARYL